mmetsp:Transcript_17709/g.49552  ORF Transcript_17709/g.49552 Transcript_17709/m.49552 type:complete len:230 (+) Transcript_17709:3740-4429(+)
MANKELPTRDAAALTSADTSQESVSNDGVLADCEAKERQPDLDSDVSVSGTGLHREDALNGLQRLDELQVNLGGLLPGQCHIVHGGLAVAVLIQLQVHHLMGSVFRGFSIVNSHRAHRLVGLAAALAKDLEALEHALVGLLHVLDISLQVLGCQLGVRAVVGELKGLCDRQSREVVVLLIHKGCGALRVESVHSLPVVADITRHVEALGTGEAPREELHEHALASPGRP